VKLSSTSRSSVWICELQSSLNRTFFRLWFSISDSHDGHNLSFPKHCISLFCQFICLVSEWSRIARNSNAIPLPQSNIKMEVESYRVQRIHEEWCWTILPSPHTWWDIQDTSQNVWENQQECRPYAAMKGNAGNGTRLLRPFSDMWSDFESINWESTTILRDAIWEEESSVTCDLNSNGRYEGRSSKQTSEMTERRDEVFEKWEMTSIVGIKYGESQS
jgi:hypothetical protein